MANSTCPVGSVTLQQTAGTPSGSTYPVGMHTVSYQATDNCSNSKACSFNVTVLDNPGSGVDCDNISITNGGGAITIGGLLAPINELRVYTNGYASIIFSCINNCDMPTQVLPNLANGNYHVIVKLYTANYQLICEKTQDIVVGGGPVSNLTITCPSNVTATAQAGQSGAVVNYNTPSANSDCQVGTVSVTKVAGPPSGSTFTVGTTTVTYRATDGCGNIKHCSFQVTVTGGQGTGDCSDVFLTVNDDSLIVNGLTAPINEIQVITGDWSTKVYSCFESCDSPSQIISMLTPGVYHVLVKFYSASYQPICETLQDIVIAPDASFLIVFDFNSAMQEDVSVGLYWLNNTQHLNDYFVVEKSVNGADFEPILQQNGTADIQQLRLYDDIDRNPVEGDNYYRIKLVFKDGSYSYSEVRKVSFNPGSNFILFPNPTGDRVNVYMKRFLGKEVDVVIFNSLGHEVYRQHLDEVKDKILPIELNRNQFKDGIYLVSVINGGRALSRRLVVTRF